MSDKRKQLLATLLQEMENVDNTGGSKRKKEQRAEIIEQMETIIMTAQQENRSLSKQEGSNWDELAKQEQEIRKELEQEQESEEREVFNIIKTLNRSDEVQVTEWRDYKTGKAIPVLKPGERLSANQTKEEEQISLGRYIRGLALGDWTGAELEKRALDTNNSSVTVPTFLSSRIIDLARQKSVILSQAQTIGMETKTMSLVKVSSDPENVGFRGENQIIPESAVGFEEVVLTAHNLAGRVVVSRELLADSPQCSSAIELALANCLAEVIDRTAMFGTGVGQPKGFDLYPGLQEITGVGQILNWDDFIDAYAKILEVNSRATGYIINPATFSALTKLTQAADGGYMLPPAPISQLAQLVSSRVPKDINGTESVAYLGNFQNIVFGIRQQLQLEIDTQGGNFTTHSVGIKMTWRGDIQVINPAEIVALRGIIA
jgi:HK97 family phage major capsid protein